MRTESGETRLEDLTITREGDVVHVSSPRLGKPVPLLSLCRSFGAVGTVGLLLGLAAGNTGMGRISAEQGQLLAAGGSAMVAFAVTILVIGIRLQQSSDLLRLRRTPEGAARWALARAIVATSHFGWFSRLLGRNAQALLLAAPWDADTEPQPRIITVNLPPQLKPASIAADGTVTPPANQAAPSAGGPLGRLLVQMIFGLPMLAAMLGVVYLLSPSEDRLPLEVRLLTWVGVWLVTMVAMNPDVQMFFERRESRRTGSETEAIERRLEWQQLQAAHSSPTTAGQTGKATTTDRPLLAVVPSERFPRLPVADLIVQDPTGRTQPAARALGGEQVAAAMGAWLRK